MPIAVTQEDFLVLKNIWVIFVIRLLMNWFDCCSKFHKELNISLQVWIHGGSLIFGSASLPGYDSAVLSSHGDVVVVSVNYRLGAMGFLSLEVPGESPGE